MANDRYSWRPGSHIRIDAQAAGKEMASMEKALHRSLTPADVLERARTNNSALHDHFEWDDGKAAEAHRIGQAGELIRSIVIDISKSNLSTQNIRAFVSVERQGVRSYTSTAHALSDKELRAQVVRKAWEDLEAWRQRHAELVEFARIFTAIDEARGL